MNIFESLVNVNTAPGAEYAAAKIITKALKSICTEAKTDALGNLIVRIGNDTEISEKTAIFVPMDAPGLVITYISDNGTVRVAPLGNIDYKSICCSDVTNGKITGVLLPDGSDTDSVDKSYVNFGFNNAAEARCALSEGDVLFFSKSAVALENGVFSGVGLGNKAAVSAVCMATEKIIKDKCIYLVFCSQSSLYQRGSYPAAFGVKPDKALCITPFGGKNFGVKVLDKSLVCDAELTDKAYKAATKFSENAERIVLPNEMSDAGKVQSAFIGVRVASILLPVKNLGSTAETVGFSDIAVLSDIIAEFLNNI